MASLRSNPVRFQTKLLKTKGQTFFDFFPELKGQKRDIACPFIVYLGTTNNTEFGEQAGVLKVGDFTTFKKIFTGKDAQIAVWENSTTYEKINEDDLFLTKNFVPGRNLRLYRSDKSIATIIEPTDEVIDATQEQTETTITLLGEGQALTKSDLYKVWIIPTQKSNEFFYITNVIEFVDANNPSEIIWTSITFVSLNDKLANTGQQLEQYISLGAPGEGYAFPELTDNNDNNNVQLDQARLLNNGITEIQVEVFGPAIITSFFAYGRRTTKTDDKVRAPKHLLGYQFNVPASTDFNQKTSAENEYYWIIDGQFDAVSFYTNWKDNILSAYDLNKTRNYEGFVSSNLDLTQGTNEGIGGALPNNIWDVSWVIENTNSPQFDGSAINYTEEVIVIPETIRPINWLALNAFIYNDTEKLPIQITESTVWTTKQIPIIGAFLNVLTLGYPITWANSEVKVQAKQISGLIPKSLYDYIGVNADIGGEGNLPAEAFRNDTVDSVGAIIGTNAIGNIINISLTDKLIKDSQELDTLNIGQSEENGGYLINGSEQTANPNLADDEGFIIDFINLKVIGKADFKITAYRFGASLFSAYFQTRSKFTSSVREWSNSFKLNAISEVNGERVSFPELIPDKAPGGVYDDIYAIENQAISDFQIVDVSTLENKNNLSIEYPILNTESYGFIWETFKAAYETIIFFAQKIIIGYPGDVAKEYLNQSFINKVIDLDIEDTEVKINTIDFTQTNFTSLTAFDVLGFSEKRTKFISLTQNADLFLKRNGNIIKLIIKRNGNIPDPTKDASIFNDEETFGADVWGYREEYKNEITGVSITFKPFAPVVQSNAQKRIINLNQKKQSAKILKEGKNE